MFDSFQIRLKQIHIDVSNYCSHCFAGGNTKHENFMPIEWEKAAFACLRSISEDNFLAFPYTYSPAPTKTFELCGNLIGVDRTYFYFPINDITR
jgi:hypothetical protein